MISKFQIWLYRCFGGITLLRKEVIVQITEFITSSCYKQIQENNYTANVAGYTISAKRYIHGYTV